MPRCDGCVPCVKAERDEGFAAAWFGICSSAYIFFSGLQRGQDIRETAVQKPFWAFLAAGTLCGPAEVDPPTIVGLL
jgi:hypothetical protein